MICQELAWETRGARPLSPEERAHVDACANCQQEHTLWRALHALDEGPAEAISSDILARAHAALAETPRAPPWQRGWMLASLLALAPGVASLLMVHKRPDLAALPITGLILNLGLLVAAFVLAGRAAFTPGLVPGGRSLAGTAATLGAAALVLFPGPHGGLSGGGPGCFGGILAASALPLAAIFALVRSRTRAWVAGMCAGLSAGALGEAAFFVHCPFSDPMHIVGAHLMAWVAVGALGAALLLAFPKRIWKPRAQRT